MRLYVKTNFSQSGPSRPNNFSFSSTLWKIWNKMWRNGEGDIKGEIRSYENWNIFSVKLVKINNRRTVASIFIESFKANITRHRKHKSKAILWCRDNNKKHYWDLNLFILKIPRSSNRCENISKSLVNSIKTMDKGIAFSTRESLSTNTFEIYHFIFQDIMNIVWRWGWFR